MRILLLTVALLIPAFNGALAFGQIHLSSDAYPKIDYEDATVGIQYHEFVLLKYDGNVIALHVMPDPRFGSDGINYRWYHLTDGSDKFFLPSPTFADASPNRKVKTGSGDAHEGKQGTGVIKAGPIAVEWSKGGHDSGWLYLSDVRDKVLVYPRQFRRLEDFSGKLDGEKWKPLKEIADSDDPLLGTWKLLKAESDGKPSKAYITKLVFKKGGTIEIHETSKKGRFASIGKFKVRVRGKVKELDEGATTDDGKPIKSRDKGGGFSYSPANRGIYKIEKDTLTICWQGFGDRPRPKAFKTKKGDRAELLVLKRLVPKKK